MDNFTEQDIAMLNGFSYDKLKSERSELERTIDKYEHYGFYVLPFTRLYLAFINAELARRIA